MILVTEIIKLYLKKKKNNLKLKGSQIRFLKEAKFGRKIRGILRDETAKSILFTYRACLIIFFFLFIIIYRINYSSY